MLCRLPGGIQTILESTGTGFSSTTAEAIKFWNTNDNKPHLTGLVLLIILMLGMSSSSGVPLQLTNRLILAEHQVLQWQKTMWNTYYENSVEKYSKKITAKRKGKQPSEVPEHITHSVTVPLAVVEEKTVYLERLVPE